jgi:hypothetical protein
VGRAALHSPASHNLAPSAFLSILARLQNPAIQGRCASPPTTLVATFHADQTHLTPQTLLPQVGGVVSELLYSPAAYGLDMSIRNMPKPRARISPQVRGAGGRAPHQPRAHVPRPRVCAGCVWCSEVSGLSEECLLPLSCNRWRGLGGGGKMPV